MHEILNLSVFVIQRFITGRKNAQTTAGILDHKKMLIASKYFIIQTCPNNWCVPIGHCLCLVPIGLNSVLPPSTDSAKESNTSVFIYMMKTKFENINNIFPWSVFGRLVFSKNLCQFRCLNSRANKDAIVSRTSYKLNICCLHRNQWSVLFMAHKLLKTIENDTSLPYFTSPHLTFSSSIKETLFLFCTCLLTNKPILYPYLRSSNKSHSCWCFCCNFANCSV